MFLLVCYAFLGSCGRVVDVVVAAVVAVAALPLLAFVTVIVVLAFLFNVLAHLTGFCLCRFYRSRCSHFCRLRKVIAVHCKAR